MVSRPLYVWPVPTHPPPDYGVVCLCVYMGVAMTTCPRGTGEQRARCICSIDKSLFFSPPHLALCSVLVPCYSGSNVPVCAYMCVSVLYICFLSASAGWSPLRGVDADFTLMLPHSPTITITFTMSNCGNRTWHSVVRSPVLWLTHHSCLLLFLHQWTLKYSKMKGMRFLGCGAVLTYQELPTAFTNKRVLFLEIVPII